MKRLALVLPFVLLLSPVFGRAANPIVRVTTPLGDFDIELCSEISALCEAAVSNSVDNFLGYVDRSDFAGSLIHRSVPNFVIQGGGFRREGPEIIRRVPPRPAIENEFHQSNLRGTVAYARTGGIVDSATSQWFVNVSDSNAAPFPIGSGLDTVDEGFTVFGVVIGDGMQVVDAIHQLPRLNIDAPQIDPLFDPSSLIGAFRQVPFPEEFFALFDPTPPDPLPPLEAFADAFIATDISRVPEPAAGVGGATALIALAALGRRQRTP